MKRILGRSVFLLSLTVFLLAGCRGVLPEHLSHGEEASASRGAITLELSVDPADPENLLLSWGPSALELADVLEEAEVILTDGDAGAAKSVTIKFTFRSNSGT